MSSVIQVMTVAGARDRFTRASYLLEVQVETCKIRSRTLGKVDQLCCWYKGTRTKGQGAKSQRSKETKGSRNSKEN